MSDMGMPAGADIEHDRTVGDPAMGQGEAHHVADRLQLEGDSSGFAPADRQPVGRIELGDLFGPAMLVAMAFRCVAGIVHQLIVAPNQFDRGADAHLHRA